MKKAYVALGALLVIFVALVLTSPHGPLPLYGGTGARAQYTAASAGRDLSTFAATKGVTLTIKWCKGPKHGYYACAGIASRGTAAPACIGIIFKAQPVRVAQATTVDPRNCA